MLRLDTNETMRALAKAGFTEVANVSIFRGFRKDKTGQLRDVEIRVEEHGSTVSGKQIHVTARTTDEGEEKFATGNGGNTLEEAFQTMRWFDLD